METFFATGGLRLINRRIIREAYVYQRGDGVMTDVTLENGETVSMDGNRLNEIAMPVAVVRAEPGFLSLRLWESDFVEEQPIIAWQINGTDVMPITPDGCVNADLDKAVIQYPDGRVVDPFNAEWLDRATWLQELRKKATAKAQVTA